MCTSVCYLCTYMTSATKYAGDQRSLPSVLSILVGMQMLC